MGGNPTTTVATSSAGRPSAAWGIGHRSSATTPPPPSSTTRQRLPPRWGGVVPPPPVRPVPPDAARRCRCRRPRSTAAARGRSGCGRTRGGGGGVWRRCTRSAGSDPPRGGRWGEEERSDVGGITWQSTSGWGRRRRRCYAARATAKTTTATGEGGGEGREVGEEVC